jgi:hypothetical protein
MSNAAETKDGLFAWGIDVKALLGFGRKRKPKMVDRASKSAAGKFNPSVSRSLAEVVSVLSADGAQNLAVNGDAAFVASLRAALPAAHVTWMSIDYRDIEAGAKVPDDVDLSSFDAVICGGGDVATRWRQSLHLVLRQQMAGNVASLPVHWVAEKWEFCSGMLPVPAQADGAEALLFNHFEQFFGIRDPLQFRVTIFHGPEEKHFYHVLEPNQSLLLKLSDYFPGHRHSAAFSARVEHPALTRGRHYRMRMCGDVFWGNSLTTLHSSHEFNRDPSRNEEFRVSSGLLRQGDMVLTVPNYDRNQPAESFVELTDGAAQTARPRDRAAYQQEVTLSKRRDEPDHLFGCRYKGYGGSFWFAFDQGGKNGGSLSGNHHVSVPWADRDMPLPADEAARLKKLLDAGFMIEPHPVPVTTADNPLRFGFDCDNANPPCRDFLLYLFDEAGGYLATLNYHKAHWGPAFAEDFLAGAAPEVAAATRLMMMAPDWLAIKHTRERYKLLADLVVENRQTGDRDVTEFQSAWRNLGVAIPDVPHWLSPANGIVGRTNLVGRVRHGQGFRTGLVVVNGSGSLAYRGKARLKIVVHNLAGKALEASIDVGPFEQQIVWLDELMPNLADLLEGPVGGLVLRSADADLNCQLLTTTPQGTVSLQHLWGY